jgi:drug/metabolite transporter (DMT)-like permease
MISWVLVVLVSYAILAISTLVDKFFLSKVIASSTFYVIWVSALSLVVFLAAPAATWIGWTWLVICLINGALFTLSLALLYKSLQIGETSRVIPVVGGSTPLITFAISYFFGIEHLEWHTKLAFGFLLCGTVLLSIMPGEEQKHKKRSSAWFFWSLSAGLSFAVFFILTQSIFSHTTYSQYGLDTTFINGIVWPRLGTLLVLIIMLMWRSNRQLVAHPFKNISWKMRSGLIGNQALAAVGFLGQNYAIRLAESKLSIILALQGAQYGFILLLAGLASWKHPHLLKEHVSTQVIILKVFALILMAVGFYYI